MTKFLNLAIPCLKASNKKVTIFEKIVTADFHVSDAPNSPEAYSNVLYLGFDKFYGDVFKCWHNNVTNFAINFGIKGDEFD